MDSCALPLSQPYIPFLNFTHELAFQTSEISGYAALLFRVVGNTHRRLGCESQCPGFSPTGQPFLPRSHPHPSLWSEHGVFSVQWSNQSCTVVYFSVSPFTPFHLISRETS